MDGFLRVFLAVLVGAVVAMGIPREIGRESRWQVAWEQTVDSSATVTTESAPSEADTDYFPAETDRRFALLDSATGTVVAAGLKTDVFHASSQAMINQATEAPRWAVQSWEGRMLRVVPRRGVPQLHGETLLQFSDDSMVYGDSVTSGEQWEATLPKNPTVYDLAHDSAGDAWFAVGTLEGTVLLTAGGAGFDGEWRHTLELDAQEQATTGIYGIAVAASRSRSDTSARPPSVHLLHGLNHQALSRLDFRADGTADRVEIGRISEEYATRGPRKLISLGEDLLVTALKGALFVLQSGDQRTSTIPVPALVDLSGIGRSPNSLVVATGHGERGPIILSGTANLSTVAPWELSDSSLQAAVHRRSTSESTVVVQRDDRLVGLELTL